MATINAKEAREKANYVGSMQHKKDIREQKLIEFVQNTDKEIENTAKQGKYYIKRTAWTRISPYDATIFVSEDLEKIKSNYLVRGFNVSITFEDVTPFERDIIRIGQDEKFPKSQHNNTIKKPIIEISW